MEYTIFYPKGWDKRNCSILPWNKLDEEMPPQDVTNDRPTYEAYDIPPSKVFHSDIVIYDTLDDKIKDLQERDFLCISRDRFIEQTVCKYLRNDDNDINWNSIMSRIESPINTIIISDKFLFRPVGENPCKNVRDIVDSIIKRNPISKLHLLIVFSTQPDNLNKVDDEEEKKKIKEKARNEFDQINKEIAEKFEGYSQELLTIELLAFNNVIGKESKEKSHLEHFKRLHDRIILTNYTLGVATFRISAFMEDGTPVQNQMIELKSIFNDINDDFNNPPLKEHRRVIEGIYSIVKFLRAHNIDYLKDGKKKNNEYGYYSRNGEIKEIGRLTMLENRLIKMTKEK